MLGSSKTGFVTARRDAGLYRRYAAGLCRQALLTRADPPSPQQVACHVSVNESALARMAERGEDDTRPRAPRGPAALWHAVMRQVRKPAAGR
jgi:hypothetical protein